MKSREKQYYNLNTVKQATNLVTFQSSILLLLPQLYNCLWVLACSVIPLHDFLSCAFCFQLFTPIFLKSSLTSSSHLNLGLPFGLIACGEATIKFVMFVRLSVRMQLIVSYWKHFLNEIWHLNIFRKSAYNIQVSLENDKSIEILCVETDTYLWSCIAYLFLYWEMFQTQLKEKTKAHVLFSTPPPPRKSCRLCDNAEKYCRTWQATFYNIYFPSGRYIEYLSLTYATNKWAG